MDTARLTDEEIMYIEDQVVEAVHPLLIGRKLFPVEVVPNVGAMTVRGYKRMDMSQARISLHGEGGSYDRSKKTPFDVTVPVIDKKFKIGWRDLEASRYSGQPLDVQEAVNAALQVGEDEDQLLITGEHAANTGVPAFPALGIEGLATAYGHNVEDSAGAWPANALKDMSDAIAELEADGHTNKSMYACVLRSEWNAKLRELVSGTATKWIDVIQGQNPLFPAGIFVSDNLFTSAGLKTSALALELGKENFEMVIERDLSVFQLGDEDMNLKCKAYEVLTPRIKRPTSICEITGLT
jgi:uncharacterized linocin/CFP29 family protein